MARCVGFCFLALWTLVCPVGWAATYYVDSVGGKDASTGLSASAAWQTIAKVSSSEFSPGDKILFKRGDTWREVLDFPSSGAPGNPIVIDAYSSGPLPVISGADFVPSGSWSTCGSCQANVWQAAVKLQPNVVILDGTKGNKQTALANLANPMDWFWTSNVLYVFSVKNPGTAFNKVGVEVGDRPAGINLSGRSFITVQNIAVSGTNGVAFTQNSAGIWAFSLHLRGPSPHDLDINHVIVTNGAGDGIHLENANHCIVESSIVTYMDHVGIQLYGALAAFPIKSGAITNNTVHDNHQNGIDIRGCPVGTRCRTVVNPEPVFVTGLTITGNRVYNNGAGIYLHETNNSTVSSNVCYSNTDASQKGEGYCVGLSGSSSNIVEKNLCYKALRSAIEASIDDGKPPTPASNNIIRYNIAHDDGTQGLMTDYVPSQNNQFYGNIVYNHPNGACILANYIGHRIYDNTCYNNQYGIHLYTSRITTITKEIEVKNNIIVNSLKYHVLIEPGVTDPLSFDHNDYYPNGPSKFSWRGKSSDFGGWQATSGQDASSLVADPQFSSASPAAPDDFTLKPNSPLSGRGTNLGSDYAEALDPRSSWPNAVRTLRRDPNRWYLGALPPKP